MKGYWQKLLVKMTFWLLAEIILTLVGLDDLADYSEFLLSEKFIRHSSVCSARRFTPMIERHT